MKIASSQANIRNTFFDQRSSRHPEEGVLRRQKHTDRRTWRLYDWIGPVGRFSENVITTQNIKSPASYFSGGVADSKACMVLKKVYWNLEKYTRHHLFAILPSFTINSIFFFTKISFLAKVTRWVEQVRTLYEQIIRIGFWWLNWPCYQKIAFSWKPH